MKIDSNNIRKVFQQNTVPKNNVAKDHFDSCHAIYGIVQLKWMPSEWSK